MSAPDSNPNAKPGTGRGYAAARPVSPVPIFDPQSGLYTNFTAPFIGAHQDNFKSDRGGDWQGVGRVPVTCVVVHTMAGFFGGTRAWFNTGLAKRRASNPNAVPSSAHFGVSSQGLCEQYVKYSDTAYHAGSVRKPTFVRAVQEPALNPNLYSVGVENEDLNDPAYVWSTPQIHCNAWLIAQVSIKFKWEEIGATQVVFHKDIDAVNRAQCPGAGAPSKRELIRLAGLYRARLLRPGLPVK